MGRMRSESDRRDEVLGSRLREAMEDLASNAEPDFAGIEHAAGPRNAMPAPSQAGRRRTSRTLFLLPAAAALALVVGLGWNRLAGARATEPLEDLGQSGTLVGTSMQAASDDPLGREVSLLARESVGGDRSLPSMASGDPDSFHEEISVFVTALWDGSGAEDTQAWMDPGEGGY